MCYVNAAQEKVKMLYTDSIKDPEKKRQAQNFKALHGASFRTASFQYKTLEEIRHREARQDKDNSLWTVYETVIKPDIKAGLNQNGGFSTKKEETPVLEKTSVMDALYNCALFEKVDLQDRIPTTNNSDIMHYEEFAAKEDITFDKQNRPHLPTPGQKKKSALQKYMIAPRNLNPALTNPQQLRQTAKEKAAKAKIEQKSLVRIQKEEQKITRRAEQFTAKFSNCAHALTTLTDAFEIAREHNYKTFSQEGEWRFNYRGAFGHKTEPGLDKFVARYIGSGSALGAPMGLSICALTESSMTGMMLGGGTYMLVTGLVGYLFLFGQSYTYHNDIEERPIFELPKGQFKRSLSRFRRKIEALPDGLHNKDGVELKKMLHNIADETELTFYTLRTRQAHRDMKTGSLREQFRIWKSTKDHFNVAAKQGCTKEQINALSLNLQQNLDSYDFDTDLINNVSTLIKESEGSEDRFLALDEQKKSRLLGPAVT